MDRIDKEGLPIRPIFISVDPDRDNVSQMRFYAQGERPATPPPLALNLGMTVLNFNHRLHCQISTRVFCT